MSATFITNGKVTYSPEISGKIIMEVPSTVINDSEYRVIYGSVNAIGKATFIGGVLNTCYSLEDAKKSLLAFSGYGRPKPEFQGQIRQKREGLAPFQVSRKSTNSFNKGFATTVKKPLEDMPDLEKTLRQKWKI